MSEPGIGAQALQQLLEELAPVRVAVSGGVDSLTLALLAGRTLGREAHMCHAISPAVPTAATARVRDLAAREGWRLELLDAGEFGDEAYLSNPYRRCYHCKRRLYATLAALGPDTLLSGTNRDDLADFRPGLQAAERYGVRHPFVECGVDKAGVRRLCRHLGEAELARLPASPCLSSRVETGLRIRPEVLGFVDRVERLLREELRAGVVRCRIRAGEIAVQLDPGSLKRVADGPWTDRIRTLGEPLGLPRRVLFETYRMGSAFVPAP